MSYTIHQSFEKRRRCGYRKGGGLYFVAGESARPCSKLPIEVSICPCCGQGIQFHRGFSWVSSQLIEQQPCRKKCQINGCYPFNTLKRYGLMWVGEQFYKTPEYFSQEAAAQGISKRLPFIPKGFVIGTDWVLLAHMKVSFPSENGVDLRPAIFSAFCPKNIDYIVTGDETEDFLQDLHDRGVRLVNVIRADEYRKTPELPELNLV